MIQIKKKEILTQTDLLILCSDKMKTFQKEQNALAQQDSWLNLQYAAKIDYST